VVALAEVNVVVVISGLRWGLCIRTGAIAGAKCDTLQHLYRQFNFERNRLIVITWWWLLVHGPSDWDLVQGRLPNPDLGSRSCENTQHTRGRR
jgi:hypothetical protein